LNYAREFVTENQALNALFGRDFRSVRVANRVAPFRPGPNRYYTDSRGAIQCGGLGALSEPEFVSMSMTCPTNGQPLPLFLAQMLGHRSQYLTERALAKFDRLLHNSVLKIAQIHTLGPAPP